MESAEKKSPRKAEETRRQLTEDLIMEILVRLPFRSIVRFQCVSKSWRSLTSYARKKLPRRHHGFFLSTSIGFTSNSDDLCRHPQGDIDTNLSFLPPTTDIVDIDVCNGLLLCHLITVQRCLSGTYSYLVSNPATRKYAMLPPYYEEPRRMCFLAFDPDVSVHYNVLSLDRTTSTAPFVYRVAIFSSGDPVWVVAEDRIELDRPVTQFPPHVFFDGVIYLLVHLSVVLGFNLQGKLSRRIKVPQLPNLDHFGLSWGMPCFGVYGGGLRFAMTENDDEMVVWELKSIKTDDWVLKHKTSLEGMAEKLPSLPSPPSGLPKFIFRSFHFNDDDDAILLTAETTLFSYNLTTTDMTEVCALRDAAHSFFDLFRPYTPYYSEDLVFDF